MLCVCACVHVCMYRGFIDSKSLHHLFALAPTSIKVQMSLTSQIIKTVIEESTPSGLFEIDINLLPDY